MSEYYREMVLVRVCNHCGGKLTKEEKKSNTVCNLCKEKICRKCIEGPAIQYINDSNCPEAYQFGKPANP